MVSIGTLVVAGLVLIAAVVLIRKGMRTVPQAHVAVVTRFGKHHKTMQAGLHFVNPFLDKVAMVIPVQNQTASLQFAAITEDQASVNFTATIIYTVADYLDATIQLVAFKFINQRAFDVALTSAVEASVREFVAGKKQAEVLGLRQDIVDHAKATLDEQLASWGYELVDLTVNDISFDSDVMKSMSRVVAAKNAQTAAEYEGQALLITRTKEAEAEGRALVIAAENGANAARLRGEGIAAQRAAIAKGLSESSSLLSTAGLDMSILAFSLWTETIRDVALQSRQNTVFLDGGLDGFEDTMRRTQGFLAQSVMTPIGDPDDDPEPHSDLARAEQELNANTSSGGGELPIDREPTRSSRKSASRGGPQSKSADAEREGSTKSGLGSVRDAVRDTVRETLADDSGKTMSQKAVDAVTRKVNPPAGWYPDPSKPSAQRYWNGTSWQ